MNEWVASSLTLVCTPSNDFLYSVYHRTFVPIPGIYLSVAGMKELVAYSFTLRAAPRSTTSRTALPHRTCSCRRYVTLFGIDRHRREKNRPAARLLRDTHVFFAAGPPRPPPRAAQVLEVLAKFAEFFQGREEWEACACLLYTSPSPRDRG